MKHYMLDTNICSFIIRKRPEQVLLNIEQAINSSKKIVISAITYSEMRYGASNPKASPKLGGLIDDFVTRLDMVLPWDMDAVDKSAEIRKELFRRGIAISPNDTAIAGHAMAANCILVTNNTREFSRVQGLKLVDWTIEQNR